MIQRIQSVYLLLTSILSLLFLKGNILKFTDDSGQDIFLTFKGLWMSDVTGNLNLIQSQIPLSVLIILIALFALVAVFLFKNRKTQMKLTIALITVISVFIALVVYDIILIAKRYQTDIILIAKMFIPLLLLIFSILAYRGIKKDEDLVRSFDRLR